MTMKIDFEEKFAAFLIEKNRNPNPSEQIQQKLTELENALKEKDETNAHEARRYIYGRILPEKPRSRRLGCYSRVRNAGTYTVRR